MHKTWKRLAVLGAAAVAVAGTLIAATDNPATAATGTWIKAAGAYGDARDNLCLDVEDLTRHVVLQPCSSRKYSQGWDLSNPAVIRNQHYNKCVSDPKASIHQRTVVLTTCHTNSPRWTRSGTITNRGRTGLIGDPFRRSGTPPSYPEDAQSFLGARGPAGAPVEATWRPWSENSQSSSDVHEEWILVDQPVYYPPDKNPCSGILCRPPADIE